MEELEKYKYHFRPVNDSDLFLIEFISGVENDKFEIDLFEAIKELSPKIVGKKDLWMNDKLLLLGEPNLGLFTLSKDVWGFAFVMSEENQDCIAKIDELLIKDNRFKKIEVDNNDYKKVKNDRF